MLVSEPNVMRPDPLLALIGSMHNGNDSAKEIRTGVYETGHFGGSHFLSDYEQYPETTVGPYGVCDNLEQLLAQCPELEAPGRKFVVILAPVVKAEQPSEGGWRWHKWGEYIGTQEPLCEYLFDEPVIEKVYIFHIYEKVSG